MKVISHGTQLSSTHYQDGHTQADVKDRDGNVVSMHFDSVGDLEVLIFELDKMASAIHDKGAE